MCAGCIIIIPKDTNRNIFHRLLCLNFGSTFQARHAHSAFYSPVFTALLLEQFLEPQMYINSSFSYLSISILVIPIGNRERDTTLNVDTIDFDIK